MSVFGPSRPIISASSICRSCRLRLLGRTQYQQQQDPQQPRSRAPLQHQQSSQRRSLATNRHVGGLANVSGQKSDDNAQNLPRWAATPSAMRAPHRLRPKTDNDHFPVNEDSDKLRQTYIRLLGNEEAVESLPEHLQWLAVTHKSFDHGRRGFNDRLAFLGKRLVEMQTTLALIDAPQSPARLEIAEAPDAFGRKPFTHETLRGISNVTIKDRILTKERLAQLAQTYGLGDVIRWKPRQIRDLKDSGLDGILAHTLYAIVGAVALQRGGEVATQTVRKRILNPLGVMEANQTSV